VSVLVHHYEPDWTRLWWVRIEGTGAVLDRAADAIASRLIDRHPQYREHPPEGPWIVITPTRLTGWEANPPAGAS
jgi:ribosomal protein L13